MMILLVNPYLFVHFLWSWPYFKVTAVANAFSWKWYVLMRLSRHLVWVLSTRTKSWLCIFLKYFRTWMRNRSAFFSDMIKTFTIAFSQTLLIIIINGNFYNATNYTCMGSLKLKTQHYKSKLKWKGDRGASKTLHMPVSKFTIHLKLYIIKLIILLIKTESHNHIK